MESFQTVSKGVFPETPDGLGPIAFALSDQDRGEAGFRALRFSETGLPTLPILGKWTLVTAFL